MSDCRPSSVAIALNGVPHFLHFTPRPAITRLFQTALSLNPGVQKVTRYRPHPAVSAARASSGQGTDVAAAEEQVEFRKLARTWLKNDFDFWKKQTSARQRLDAGRTYRLWLGRLLGTMWKPGWDKTRNTSPRPHPHAAKQKGAHTSVQRRLQIQKSKVAT